VGSGPVLWAETPDDEQAEVEAHGNAEVDESFATRKLRRWLRGMFGGEPAARDERSEDEPDT
jgi:hypothetical protein